MVSINVKVHGAESRSVYGEHWHHVAVPKAQVVLELASALASLLAGLGGMAVLYVLFATIFGVF